MGKGTLLMGLVMRDIKNNVINILEELSSVKGYSKDIYISDWKDENMMITFNINYSDKIYPFKFQRISEPTKVKQAMINKLNMIIKESR